MESQTALVIGHPAHELCVYGWLTATRPLVFVLTDGSPHRQQARLPTTQKILVEAGCRCSDIFGLFTDADIYAAMLKQDTQVFIQVVEKLAATLQEHKITTVAGDAIEGFNPTHDLCRIIIGAAAELVMQRSGRQLANYDFLLVGPPDQYARNLRPQDIKVSLDAATFHRKSEVAKAYKEIDQEVRAALKRHGTDIFKVEYLRAVNNREGYINPLTETPFYEKQGERQVAAGHYREAIRYCSHIRPIIEGIWSYVERQKR